MRIACIGRRRPGGLYFAYLWKRRHPEAQVDLFEQNPAGVTWGFGVVFSDQALEFLRADDPDTVDAITPHMESWTQHHAEPARRERRDRRRRLLLDRPACAVEPAAGARACRRRRTALRHADPVAGSTRRLRPDRRRRRPELAGAARLRRRFRQLAVLLQQQVRLVRHDARRFETLSQTFVETDLGSFNAHHYRYSPR